MRYKKTFDRTMQTKIRMACVKKKLNFRTAQRYAKIYSDNNTEKYIAFSNQKPTKLKDIPQIYAKS